MDTLLENIEKIHTTEMGAERIRKNLVLECSDPVEKCLGIIKGEKTVITRKGKNYYAEDENYIITINAHSFTIITAHRKTERKNG